ncbi:MAG: MMPL family transporter [Magnetococcales bacterium]|nr:MMPL family transporter [Magnetococcales bacterium]
MNGWMKTMLRWRWLVVLIGIAVVGAAGSGARLLRFDTDYRVFFSDENPQLVAFETIQNTYTKNDNVLFTIAPKSGKVFSRDTLAMIQELTEKSWQIPYSIRVDSLTNYQHTEAEEDDLIVADLVESPQDLSDADLERIKTIAINEPLLLHRLISPKADTTAVNVTIQLAGKRPDLEVPEVAAFARTLAQEMRTAYPEVEIHLTGMSMMNNAFPEASKRDMATLIPIMFLVVLVTLGFMVRSISAMFASLLVIIFSIVTAMGITGWLGIALTGPSAGAPTIILTMAVADCVHILVTFFQGMRRDGLDKETAILESLRINAQPVFLTSATTAIGFLSMNFGEVPPFHDLGNIVTMGVLMAYALSMTFLPCLIMILPISVKTSRDEGAMARAMDRFAGFVIKRRSPLLWLMSGITLLLIAFIPSNELNDEFVKYFSKEIEFRRATDFTTDHLTGIYAIEYSLESGSSNGVADPEFLANVEAFAQWYRSQPEVIHVNSITDIFKRLNKSMHGDDPSYYKLPDARDLSAQYLLLYEMSLPYGLDLNNQINVDKSSTRFTVTMHSISTNQVLDVEKRAQAWMRTNLPETMVTPGASPTIMFANIGKRNIMGMLTGTTIALVLISFLMIAALRSLKVGLISIIPNLAPMAMAFGIWGIMVGQVGLALSVVTGMTLGIVVDDSVHFLSKYLRARREKGLGSHEAVRYAFNSVGTALWVTSIVLVAGFFVLTFSTFKFNSGMGLLTAMTIALALVADFLLLPPLLMKLEKNQ